MKTTLLLLLMTACSLCTMRAAAQADAAKGDVILGRWTNEEKTRTVEFVKKEGRYEGIAIVTANGSADVKGRAVITGLQFDGKKYTGQVYAPKKEKLYPCSIVLNGADKMLITGKAGFISQTKTWTRVK